jgi:hypothetical protein
MMSHLDHIGRGVFAENALNLWHRGLAVLPAYDKKPAIKGWRARKSRYGEKAITNFSLKMPSANIAYQPGLSVPDKEHRLIVLDCDDLEVVDQVQNIFGETPGTLTSRGRHCIFKVHFTELDEITRLVGTGGDLRKVNLNVDVKHGSSIVMAGGSFHPNGHEYLWDGPDVHGPRFGGGFLRNAQHLNVPLLGDLVGVRSRLVSVDGAPVTYDQDGSAGEKTTKKVQVDGIESEWRNGSRKLGLNDYLISRVSGCGSNEELLQHAHNFNDDRCSLSLKGVLDAEVLEEFTRCVWEDHLKSPMARWSGGPATAQTMVWEIAGGGLPR